MNLEDLKQSFAQGLFLQINERLIEGKFTSSQLSITPDNSKFITNTKYYGNYEGLDLHILTIEHSSTEDARIGVSLDIFKLMKKYSLQNALVAAYSTSSDNWRYSLVTSSLSVNDKGKVTKEFSNPRRYSFVLGTNQKVLTPFKQLIQSGKVSDIQELSKRFSLEVVNNEFYKEIARLYDQLVGTEKIERKLKYPGSDEESHEFVVRLIGRIIFCWFLREKKSAAGIPLIPSDILSREASSQTNYYHGTLAPLFFEVLNKTIDNRAEKFKANGFKKIPYLNGGLFSDDEIDKYKFDPQLQVTHVGPVYADVPDDWLRELFDLLERFNFTVDENTSFDTDLSIDPEMLGRVFENLLARINPETGETVRKSTGSFYTPREIVDYMVDSSLVEYLVNKTGINRVKLDALLSYDLLDDEGNELSKPEGQEVLEALSTLTVLDPACGSGAYPIGMLQKIVYVISILDPDAKWWLAKQLESASPELKREFQNKGVDYVRKLGIIRQTIFGVDIQPIATEISRLRCFLTLIVDENIDDSREDRGIKPLPNLDFKFVTANTLIKLPVYMKEDGLEQISAFDDHQGINELQSIMSDYFSAPSEQRDSIKYQFVQKQKTLAQKMFSLGAARTGTLTSHITNWDPFEHKPSPWFDPKWMYGIEGGFDIVIGNPPYFQLQKNKQVSEELAPLKYKTFSKSSDIYCVFFERGIQLLRYKGILTYITSNSWMKTKYGQSLRKLFVESTNPMVLINFDDSQIFNSAIVESNILVVKKDKYNNELRALSYSPAANNQTISEYFNNNYIHIPVLHETGWIISSTESAVLRNKLENQSKPLKEYNQKIYIGLLNGYNAAYVIDTKTKDSIVSKDPKSADIIKPMLRGRDVGKYGYIWSGMWMINTHNGIRGKLPRIDVENDYPVIYQHLLKYRHKLEVRQNKGDHWTNLRNCAYFQEFDKPKIVWGELSDKPKFAYDDKGYIAEATLFAMVAEKPMYLLGILNSKLALWYFDQITTSSGMGTSRWKKYKIEQLPICIETPDNTHLVNDLEHEVAKLTLLPNTSSEKSIEKNIDNIVYELYNLTPEEIALIESSTI